MVIYIYTVKLVYKDPLFLAKNTIVNNLVILLSVRRPPDVRVFRFGTNRLLYQLVTFLKVLKTKKKKHTKNKINQEAQQAIWRVNQILILIKSN